MRGNVVILDSAKFPRKKYLGLEVNALTRTHQLLLPPDSPGAQFY